MPYCRTCGELLPHGDFDLSPCCNAVIDDEDY